MDGDRRRAAAVRRAAAGDCGCRLAEDASRCGVGPRWGSAAGFGVDGGCGIGSHISNEDRGGEELPAAEAARRSEIAAKMV